MATIIEVNYVVDLRDKFYKAMIDIFGTNNTKQIIKEAIGEEINPIKILFVEDK